MHIVLGFLGTVVTILWLLHRLAEMGIDLGGLNPWLWQRRRKWRQQYETNPIFAINDPMDSTALLMTAVAKADGDMTSAEKDELLAVFQEEFSLSKRDAAGLLLASTHLLGRGEEVRSNLEGVLKPSLESFSEEQAGSAIGLLKRISESGGPASEQQIDLIISASEILNKRATPRGKWDKATG